MVEKNLYKMDHYKTRDAARLRDLGSLAIVALVNAMSEICWGKVPLIVQLARSLNCPLRDKKIKYKKRERNRRKKERRRKKMKKKLFFFIHRLSVTKSLVWVIVVYSWLLHNRCVNLVNLVVGL